MTRLLSRNLLVASLGKFRANYASQVKRMLGGRRLRGAGGKNEKKY